MAAHLTIIEDLPKHQHFQYISGQVCSIEVHSDETNVDRIQPVFSRCTSCNKEKDSSGRPGSDKYFCDSCHKVIPFHDEEMYPFEAKIGSVVIDYLEKMRKEKLPMPRILNFNVKIISSDSY